jgi:hypothetical protein
VYAGIAKLNSDWLSGQPLDMWLDVHKEVPVVGPILASRTAALVASYGGIFIDLILGPLLLVRRARVPALVIMASFHLLNSLIFSIGIFPWMMLGANLLFLDPDWPRRLPKVLNWILESGTHKQASPKPQRFAPLSPIVLACIAAWSTFQILFPLRHHLYPGDVAWTEEGHRYSWRMKLRDKRGPTNFYVAGADGKRRKVAIEKHLTKRQLFKLSCDPEMILEFAHYLADQEQRSGTPQPRVYARARCSLNGHPERDLINPDVDLAAIDDSLWPAAWILPLTEAGPKNRTK